ncbi:hypothetical protein Tco_0795360 [Tanacetum coccineum]
MSTLTFSDTHNMVAFLEKPVESDGFHEIIDFLNANQIHYALTINPTICTSCIEQFWTTAKAKTVNGEFPHPSDSTTDVPNKESVPTHSNDLLLSGEDRLKLTDLMDMCIKLSERVLDLEHTKTAQAQEITNLKLRVKKLEKKSEVSTATPSTTAVSPPVITKVEITLAQTLAKLKSAKSKVVIQEPVQSTATTAPSTIPKAKRHYI